MTQPNEYHDYPANKPPKDGYYLVSIKRLFLSRIGLNPSPEVLIAQYSQANQEWTTVLGLSSIGVGNIASDVLAWCELPIP